MKYVIRYKRTASDELLQLPPAMARKALALIKGLAENPRPHNCKKMKGTENAYRLRFGNYRIVYTISDAILTITVIKVAHRKHVYR